MEPFLRSCKSYVVLGCLNHFEEVHVVLGNESCDLDSAVASVVTAFLLHQKKSELKCAVLPVLNIVRRDFRLRTEVTFFLQKTNIPFDLLIFKDEIDLEKLRKEKRLCLTLVDHNVLSADQQCLEEAVVRVIDHHKLECRDRRMRCDMTVEMVGSCCTLVAEKMFTTCPSVIDQQIAMLLYGTILLDTVCLLKEAKRATEKDINIVIKLETKLEKVTRIEVFEALQKAKFDLSGLTFEEMLRKDLKVVEGNKFRIAIPSIPGFLEDLKAEPKLSIAMEEFITQNNYHGLVIMTIHHNSETRKVQRQIAVYSPDPVIKEQIVNTLKGAQDPGLELEPLHLGISDLMSFNQRNIAASRKVVLPLVRSFIQESPVSSHSAKGSKIPTSSSYFFHSFHTNALTRVPTSFLKHNHKTKLSVSMFSRHKFIPKSNTTLTFLLKFLKILK
ncbi:exopolyphosphatase PRUNE1-like isoform X2 [Limulus polyphemus]|uniref:Exopolyphosphatase PRUNE1-like isoform X2 n=1 Tax=Limulus polyphemus TaxID=6850 RepID=A0ABM1C2G2_LIMPO|nr:exopolyphosphatase PRUNE1-like isoform X2 [Limulus polyphemus]